MNGESNRIFRFGEFRLDPNKRILTRGDQTIALTAKAFDLLVFLVENSGVIISKEKILDTVWKDQFVEETNLTVQISGLRRLFGEKKGEYNYIVTIPGKGYKFVAETADDSSAEYSDAGHGPRPIHDQKEIAEKPAMRQPAAKLYTTPRFFLLALGPLLILMCGLVAYNYLSPTPAPPINSVAVLPFVNQNNDDDSEYLSDGISESLIYSLSQLPDLRVMSRNSSSRYKGKEFDSKSVGEELQVQAIVTGRVLVKGNEITVSAELIDARSNSVIWGEQFNRRLTDIFTLQAEMGRAISQRMRSKLTLPQQERVERGAEPNSEAYQLYLQGIYFLNKRTPEDIRKSVEFFRQSVVRDPSFARGYGGLAMAYNLLPRNSVMTKSEVLESKAGEKTATLRALELDEALAEGHALLGEIRSFEWDFAGAENSFRRAIELNPNLAIARQWYSELLSRLGRHDEAITEILKAQQLDPLSRDVNLHIALRYQEARRPDEAIAQFKKVTEMEPDHAIAYELMSSALAASGRFEEAVEAMSRGEILFGIETTEVSKKKVDEIRDALRTGGNQAFWQKNLKYTMKYYERGINSPFFVATAYARLGDKMKTFEWLEKCFAERDPWIVHLKAEPAFDSFESDPRYIDLLLRVGLPR